MRMNSELHLSVMAGLLVFSAITGCASRSVLDGRSATHRLSNRLEDAHEVTRRCFPANWDESQYCVFGTNGWMSVEYYPDGLPCRLAKGTGVDGPKRNVTLEEREFDFFGKELSSQADDSFMMRGSGSYVRCLSRVYSGASVLSKDYSFDMYYYGETNSCIIVCAWGVDRKNGVMDKLVFSIDAPRSVSVPVMDVRFHAGDLIDICNAKSRDDRIIDIEFNIKAGGKTFQVYGCVDPSRGRRQ